MASAPPPTDDDLFDLDFTSAPPAIEPEAAPKDDKSARPLALEPLELVVPGESIPAAPLSLPPIALEPLQAPASAPPAPDVDDNSLDFCASLTNEALTVSSLSLEPIEEPVAPAVIAPDLLTQAALLAAEGRYIESGETIAKAIVAGMPRDREEFAWRMLFELDLRLNNRPIFEQRALDFAAVFEKSPPVWTGDTPQVPNGKVSGKGAAMISLSGPLRQRAAPAIAQMLEVAQKRPTIHLDLSRLRDVDEEGCTLLLDGLRTLKKMRRECHIEGAEHTISLAQTKLALGKPENENIWLLVLELLQRCGENERFDDWAVNYAVTFEMSPPAYEAPAVPSTSAAVSAKRNVTDGWPLAGDWLGEDEQAFAPLQQAIDKGEAISAIDACALRCIDLTTAQALGRVLAKLATRGHRLIVRNLGYLHQPLLELAQVGLHANIELHK